MISHQESAKTNSKIYVIEQSAWNDRKKKKNQSGGLTLFDFNVQSNQDKILAKDKYTDQWKRIDSPETDRCIYNN